MDLSTTLILIGIFILMEAFFSGSEIGMIAINRIKMKKKADEGNGSAQIVLNLLNTPEKLFATTSLGTNLAVVSSTSIFTAYMVTNMGPTRANYWPWSYFHLSFYLQEKLFQR